MPTVHDIVSYFSKSTSEDDDDDDNREDDAFDDGSASIANKPKPWSQFSVRRFRSGEHPVDERRNKENYANASRVNLVRRHHRALLDEDSGNSMVSSTMSRQQGRRLDNGIHTDNDDDEEEESSDQYSRIRSFFQNVNESGSDMSHTGSYSSRPPIHPASRRDDHHYYNSNSHRRRFGPTSHSNTANDSLGQMTDSSFDGTTMTTTQSATQQQHNPRRQIQPHTIAEETTTSSSLTSFPSLDEEPTRPQLKLSAAARKAQEELLQAFNRPGGTHGRSPNGTTGGLRTDSAVSRQQIPSRTVHNSSSNNSFHMHSSIDSDQDVDVSTQPSTVGDTSHLQDDSINLALHDLCSEASGSDDLAWHNALYLLSVSPHLATTIDQDTGWTALHVSCLGNTPPPLFWITALLYAAPDTAQQCDHGGRLPLHMVAASSGDYHLMRQLVLYHPSSVSCRDDRGLAPLHMLLRNQHVELTIDRVRLLLGQNQTNGRKWQRRPSRRNRDHLHWTIEDLAKQTPKPPDHPDSALAAMDRMGSVNRLENGQYQEDVAVLGADRTPDVSNYSNDVQACFQKLFGWKHKMRKERYGEEGMEVQLQGDTVHGRQNGGGGFVDGVDDESETNPAAMAIEPSSHLPLHLVVKRALSFSPNDSDNNKQNNQNNSQRGLAKNKSTNNKN